MYMYMYIYIYIYIYIHIYIYICTEFFSEEIFFYGWWGGLFFCAVMCRLVEGAIARGGRRARGKTEAVRQRLSERDGSRKVSTRREIRKQKEWVAYVVKVKERGEERGK